MKMKRKPITDKQRIDWLSTGLNGRLLWHDREVLKKLSVKYASLRAGSRARGRRSDDA
jgi:hypothetical protein